MKKATSKEVDKSTEEKVNKNQDPRNGKAIPGKGESGFRADAYKLDDSNNAQLPDTATTGTDKFTFVALPENDSRRNSGAIALADGRAGDIVVYGTGGAPTDLEIEMYSSQRTGQVENPVAMSTVNGEPATSPGRMDYPLSKEQVQKLQEEAKLWRNKEKPDGNRISNNPATVFGSSGAYEFLATEIYKLGYEQGVDRVYIPNISNRFAVTEKAKKVGWKIKSIEPSNLPPGLIYDRESDSIQGRVVANLQNGVYDFRFDVAAENEKTHQIVRMKFQNLRSGWIGWQDTRPPKIEVSNDAYEATVGQNVNIEVKYSDDAGSNFSGDKRRVKYTLKDGRVVEIGNQSYRQAVSGLAGYPTTKNQGTAPTSIPGVDYDLSRDKTPTEKEDNGDEKIFGKGMLIGSPTKAGIYTVSVFAKDYNNKNKSDTTWIHSGHEVQKYITVVVKPTVTVKNIHAYATNIPVTISDGASTAELTLPNGKVIKLEARNGNWTLADGGAVLGPVGGEINVPVSQEDTKDAAVDTIKVKAITENVKATLLRNEIELLGDDGQKHTARLSETTGHWELEDAYKVVKTPTADGGYKLTKRQVYTEVQADGSTNYYIYSYTRTFNADDKVVSVDEVTRPKTVVPRLNTENTDGATTIVEYDTVTKEWKSSDGSNVTATKEGDFWKVRTESGFTGLIKGSKAESLEDKGSILNDAPTATSTSYTTVKGATVDLVKQKSAEVTITDREDDATTAPTKKETTVTKVTLTSPSGTVTEYSSAAEAAAVKLSEVGTYTVKVEVKDSNGNVVTADTETDTGTNKGADTAVASTTYTITIKDQPTDKVYAVEDEAVTSDQLKEKVVPTEVDGFTATKNDIADIPTTAKKAGQTLEVPATVTYTKGTEAIPVETKVDVVVLPIVKPTGVTVLKDSTGLEEAVKAKAVEAATATTKLPDGVTVRVKEIKAGTVPATTATGVQTPATAVVEYVKDGNVVKTREVPVPVTVVGSTASNIVVFEGDTVEAKTVQDAVTPGTDGTKGSPAIPEDLTKTTGKKEVTVPVTYEGMKDPEQVKVPVTVLPKATGEVEVPKGSTVDKVKESAKAKAQTLTEAADFKGKLPAGATVTVGDVTEAVAETLTNEKGANKGVVNVPVTYTVDGIAYNTTIPVTINVLGSEPKTVYTVEGTKPDAEKVKNAVTPGAGGTVNTPKETDLPATTVKAGTPDVTVPTTVTYPSGDETVKVPVEVLPKAIPEKVTTLKDTTGENLTTAVKEKAQAALGKLTLPSGVTAELVPNQTYTVPVTDSNGDKDNVPVKIQYKDATGTVVAEDTINVPVTVVSSTPKPLVVFEGDTVEAKTVQDAVTPGTDGTKGNPAIPEDLTKTTGKKEVTVPVTYEGIKAPEQVKVPVTVLPVAKGEVTVPKGETTDKVKEVAKAKAEEVVSSADFKAKLPDGAKDVEVGAITEEVLATITSEAGTNKGTVKVPVTYTVDGVKYTKDAEITVSVVGSNADQVYVVEGDKPEIAKVKDAVTPGKGGTVQDPTEANLPDTKDKVGATDVTVSTKVKYANGEETVKVPVTVLPKVTPEGVTVLKDSDKQELEKAIKEQAEKAANNVKGLPSGVTVTVTEVKTGTVPPTATVGVQNPATVVVEYVKDGKVVATKEVPVPVNVVEVVPVSIETPVTKTPLTPEDYTKGITIPEGGKVTNVENIPDLTTPGKKDPVKVTVELPNGKVITVEVPVNVTPVKEIETPVTNTPLTPEDYTKGIKIPEGGKVTNVENIPDLTTPGKKNPVKVTVELPNRKVITVEVPVTVTSINEIVKNIGDPITNEDVEKNVKIPEGGKIVSIGDKPGTDTPGVKPVVPVVIELPNGKQITVEVPVIVTPKVSTIIVPQGTVITPEDVKNHIDLPKEPGWEIVEIGEIPSTIPAGVKPSVKVKVKLPNGKVIELEVPIISTPKVTPIEVEVGTPITKDDVKKHVELPKEEGWEIVEVGEIPTTETPGQKTAVKVKVKLPTGEIVELEVPVTVTPKATPAPRPTVKTTPIVVEVGTPITKVDVIKHVELPKGAEIVEVGEIPTTETAGQKPSIKVKVKLPTGEIIEVEVPVTVTPKKETPRPRPEKPSTPEVPATPEAPKAPVAKVGEKVLPNTGIADENSALAGLGLAILGLVGLRRRRKQK